MDRPQSGFERLPLELRQQIYNECFELAPQPGLLCTNKRIRSEATRSLQRWQQTFSFHISAEAIGFDEFSQWCFKVKGHVPRLNKMKHIVLYIYPPDLDKPIEMFRIWNHVLSFCQDLGSFRQIPQLTVKFFESDIAKWTVNGVAYSTMQLTPLASRAIPSDVTQTLHIFCHFVNNVEQPKVYFPQSCIDMDHCFIGRHLPEVIERQMTGMLTEEERNWNNESFGL
ncbi:MAG: hypothetical protein Q9195_004983 [Heterodermia aff. obscurata]